MTITVAAITATPNRSPQWKRTWLRHECAHCGWVYNKDGKAIEASVVVHRCPRKGGSTVALKPVDATEEGTQT